ncbi:S-adenosyl-L-methionine-dependent methyltransferase [Lepidopterella palustris CBS 459.81]|uniref:S-adenosyl-L-methionine-dependent methyltransferase n=1 Tax=Lepidopterella palustris CBS 459.81 TaxID=1314670 RepID=A0A8E2E620_9PEZI|nr:S-adenosyl-L-methionine-dependent methyltransferase [Lepidopterella palustris CBS 459.81]
MSGRTQNVNNTRFNAEAAAWDSNPGHIRSSENALKSILHHVPDFTEGKGKDIDVLEIGCGTGLLSFMLAPHVRSLVGVDTAEGMISAFNAKIGALPNPETANLAAVNVLLEDADDVHVQGAAAALATRRGDSRASEHAPHRFDLVVSHLTLHHIPSLPAILETMFQSLKPGGWIALTDFEDFGSDALFFHPKSKREGVERHGIKRDEIEMMIKGTGFENVKVATAFTFSKDVDAEDRLPERNLDFPFLICLGQKA